MIELERTFLAKHLPQDLQKHPAKDMVDVYIPASAEHPVLRIRKNGNNYEMTKKQPVKQGDSSIQKEETIILSPPEYTALMTIQGKRVEKKRYKYPYQGLIAEIDVFGGGLQGLVLVDFEFANKEEMHAFVMPSFCLVEITQEKFTAGGMLCGKSYQDIEHDLKRFGYHKILISKEVDK
jgi:CYTH domain-containing protein